MLPPIDTPAQTLARIAADAPRWREMAEVSGARIERPALRPRQKSMMARGAGRPPGEPGDALPLAAPRRRQDRGRGAKTL